MAFLFGFPSLVLWNSFNSLAAHGPAMCIENMYANQIANYYSAIIEFKKKTAQTNQEMAIQYQQQVVHYEITIEKWPMKKIYDKLFATFHLEYQETMRSTKYILFLLLHRFL